MNKFPFLLIILIGFCYPKPAAAYLDPGAGSLMLQMLIAGIMGLIVTLKIYWYRLKNFVARILGKKQEPENNHDDENTIGEE